MRCRTFFAFLLIALTVFTWHPAKAQRFLSEYDSTLFLVDTMLTTVRRFENLHISGYMQPQFQVAQHKGAASFEGGNFADSSASRFQLRRARIKVDYRLPAKGQSFPLALFTFQFDITERGAFARDVFLRLFDPKGQKLSGTIGLFARPFGYEVNLASASRESPERGRMSQTLMPAERDLGAMLSYESKAGGSRKPLFKWDAGFFNGPGLSGTTDFDSYKDFISRIALKPYKLSPTFWFSAGASLLYGGWMQATRYRYQTRIVGSEKIFVVDSSIGNAGSEAPRHYYGADAQLVWKKCRDKTELRAEYWSGIQPGTAFTTVNPGTLPSGPTYLRRFNGAFFYFLQSFAKGKWEAVAKYDWYDPNTGVKGLEIGKAGSNFTAADLRYDTFGAGITRYLNDNLKLLAYYSFVRNETTALGGFATDTPDDVFTFRMQLRF